MSRVRIPSRRPEDWRRLLADPDRHWRVGYSAYELAHAWQATDKFPRAVATALAGAPFGQLELLIALPEHKVTVPGRGGESVTDVFALGRSGGGDLVAIAVEGKVSESFDKPVREWLDDPEGNRDNRQNRLAGLAARLGQDASSLGDAPYQLLHRTVAALIEARRYNAAHAVLLVHSFSRDRSHHAEYRGYARLLGTTGDPGRVESVGRRDGVELHLCWVTDQPRHQAHDGEPERVLLDALDWLRESYREHRFFKERDVEAALQQRMTELFTERRSAWCVIENYKTIDIAVVDRNEPGPIAVGAEIKYEPDHLRPGEEARRKTGKHPVTDWPDIAKDHDKLRSLVADGSVAVGYALLVDEGGYFRRSKTPPPFGEWQVWGDDSARKMAPALLIDRITATSNVHRTRSPDHSIDRSRLAAKDTSVATRLLRNERTTRLGRLGEALAAERLNQHGFSEVENLNSRRVNFPFADLIAVRGGRRFLISVKTRNEMRQGGAQRNESYNLIQVRDSVNVDLKNNGMTTDDITRLLLEEVQAIAVGHDAEPAWVTVAVRATAGTYSAYFGLVASLGHKRSIPMTAQACRTYESLAQNRRDPRITPDLLNA